jgi:hypothetical protein
MKILGLPGVKSETKKWMQALLSALQETTSFDFEIAQYRHWSDDHVSDISHEASCLAESSVDFVIAKSLGTIISTLAFDSHNFKPQKAIFIGSPIGRHRSSNYELLSKFVDSVPTLFIQQSFDPIGSYAELNDVVQTYQYGTIVEVPGRDHMYSDIGKLRTIIQPVLSGDT